MDILRIIDTSNLNETHKEVRRIYENLFGSGSFHKVEYTLNDIDKLFNGEYPGYQKCDTGYHDLEHTMQAYLAMARILNGLVREKPEAIPDEFVVLGLISALGHDTGYIKETWDTEGSGAKYTLIHVGRSREFMGKYLSRLGYSLSEIHHVQRIISCTGIRLDLSTIDFTSEEEKLTGHVLGTADLLGQMSSPDYPEKLLKLYDEFKEGGVSDYASLHDFLNSTPAFFEDTVMKRFTGDFNSVYLFAANHFGGQNLYIEAIKRNITQIKQLSIALQQ